MGMTIDKAIEHGKEQLEIFGGEHKEFIETAIETMRKYQKIVNIVSLNDEEFKQCGLTELKEILEVIADGKID